MYNVGVPMLRKLIAYSRLQEFMDSQLFNVNFEHCNESYHQGTLKLVDATSVNNPRVAITNWWNCTSLGQ